MKMWKKYAKVLDVMLFRLIELSKIISILLWDEELPPWSELFMGNNAHLESQPSTDWAKWNTAKPRISSSLWFLVNARQLLGEFMLWAGASFTSEADGTDESKHWNRFAILTPSQDVKPAPWKVGLLLLFSNLFDLHSILYFLFIFLFVLGVVKSKINIK